MAKVVDPVVDVPLFLLPGHPDAGEEHLTAEDGDGGGAVVGGDVSPTAFGRVQQLAALDEERGFFQRPIIAPWQASGAVRLQLVPSECCVSVYVVDV